MTSKPITIYTYLEKLTKPLRELQKVRDTLERFISDHSEISRGIDEQVETRYKDCQEMY